MSSSPTTNTPPTEPNQSAEAAAAKSATGSNNNAADDVSQQSQSPNTTTNHNHNNNTNKLKSAQNSGTGSIDKLSPDKDIFINPVDGLPNSHPNLPKECDVDSDTEHPEVDPDSFDDLPTSIIVTNIHSEVFATPQLKQEMEDLFRTFSESATFQWLRSFRRLRVNYDNAIAAANARIKLHQYEFNKKTVITCYFAQPVTPVSNKNLQPPAPVKQFLISPPASPPAGWEPREENEPLVNHDLLAALASLTPGESHELHPQTEDQPGIIVHTATILAADPATIAAGGKPPIQHTKCPERAS